MFSGSFPTSTRLTIRAPADNTLFLVPFFVMFEVGESFIVRMCLPGVSPPQLLYTAVPLPLKSPTWLVLFFADTEM